MDKATNDPSRTAPTRPDVASRTTSTRKAEKSVTKSELQPVFTRLDKSMELTPPEGCSATVVLKQVGNTGKRLYYWWLMVGRYEEIASTVHYKHEGGDMIRCDMPVGMPLCEDALLPGLQAFFAQQDTLGDTGPIATGPGHGGTHGG